MTEPFGWDASAQAWIATQGNAGDFARQFVLDRPMMARVRRGFRQALDVGCGEGRFCRMLRREGVGAVGIDPTAGLIEEARRRDPDGDYRIGRAEALETTDAAFDLVVSYLSLIDIDDIDAAIAEMARVLKPGGALLVANLTGFATASLDQGWRIDLLRGRVFEIDRYLESRRNEARWRGIAVHNWHRPLEVYMQRFLAEGLQLVHFAEPAPHGGPSEKADRYTRVPQFVVMEWRKP